MVSRGVIINIVLSNTRKCCLSCHLRGLALCRLDGIGDGWIMGYDKVNMTLFMFGQLTSIVCPLSNQVRAGIFR